jgi:TolA-binding protein
MAETGKELEGQLGFLTEQVKFLNKKVDELSVRLQRLETGESVVQEPEKAQTIVTPVQKITPVPQPGVLKKAGTGALLPRVATQDNNGQRNNKYTTGLHAWYGICRNTHISWRMVLSKAKPFGTGFPSLWSSSAFFHCY